MPEENLRAEVEWLSTVLAASEVPYERGLATRLQQFLEVSPELRRSFANTTFTASDLNWFQPRANADEALTGDEYAGERIDFGNEARRAQAVLRNLRSLQGE
jgi:hypothetical protein